MLTKLPKVGDKVRYLIDAWSYMTRGKTYEVVEVFGDAFYIRGDKGTRVGWNVTELHEWESAQPTPDVTDLIANLARRVSELESKNTVSDEPESTAEVAVVNALPKLYPKYYKDVTGVDSIDVYMTHELFGIDDPSGAIQHASKKLLLSGVRTGGKSKYSDIKEARDTLTRWLEINEADSL